MQLLYNEVWRLYLLPFPTIYVCITIKKSEVFTLMSKENISNTFLTAFHTSMQITSTTTYLYSFLKLKILNANLSSTKRHFVFWQTLNVISMILFNQEIFLNVSNFKRVHVLYNFHGSLETSHEIYIFILLPSFFCENQFSTWMLLIVIVNISSMHRFLFIIIISSDFEIINENVISVKWQTFFWWHMQNFSNGYKQVTVLHFFNLFLI